MQQAAISEGCEQLEDSRAISGSIQGAYEDALYALRTLLHGYVTAFQPGKAAVTAQKARCQREH